MQRQRLERKKGVVESKYNISYKWIREEKLPEYLDRRRKERKWKMIARYRLGNEMRGGRY